MHKKIRITPLLAAALAALSVGVSVAAFILSNPPSGDNATVVPSTLADDMQNNLSSTTPALPSRLRIPALNIDAHVQHVGRTPAGLMADPSNFTDVAWYAGDARPGQKGSAVIAGHVDNALGLDGVFKHLNDLAVGDDVYVETATGETLHFRVTRTEVYPYDNVPVNDLFAETGGTYLNLVTCSGAWLRKQRTYDHRLVVYTELAAG